MAIAVLDGDFTQSPIDNQPGPKGPVKENTMNRPIQDLENYLNHEDRLDIFLDEPLYDEEDGYENEQREV